MSNLFQLSTTDINSSINHEPRILDLRIAEALGYDNPRNIRRLIQRNKATLEKFATLSTVERVIKGGKAREYYLNEKQAIYLCTKSETENATDITIQMVEVFYQVRNGNIQPSTITQEQAQQIKELVSTVAEAIGKSHGEIYRRFWNKFGITEYKKLPYSKFDEAIKYLMAKLPEQNALIAPSTSDKKALYEAFLAFGEIDSLAEELSSIDFSGRKAPNLAKRVTTLLSEVIVRERKKVGKKLSQNAEYKKLLDDGFYGVAELFLAEQKF